MPIIEGQNNPWSPLKYSMNEIAPPAAGILDKNLPFPREWLISDPGKVEQILNEQSLEDQARCFLSYTGIER